MNHTLYPTLKLLIMYYLDHFVKIFILSQKNVVDECTLLFLWTSVITAVYKRKAKFLEFLECVVCLVLYCGWDWIERTAMLCSNSNWMTLTLLLLCIVELFWSLLFCILLPFKSVNKVLCVHAFQRLWWLHCAPSISQDIRLSEWSESVTTNWTLIASTTWPVALASASSSTKLSTVGSALLAAFVVIVITVRSSDDSVGFNTFAKFVCLTVLLR